MNRNLGVIITFILFWISIWFNNTYETWITLLLLVSTGILFIIEIALFGTHDNDVKGRVSE